jgi:hypothetical protein
MKKKKHNPSVEQLVQEKAASGVKELVNKIINFIKSKLWTRI